MNEHFRDFDNGRFYLGECLETMASFPDGIFDMVMCDLPYGTTNCKWDSVIPFELLWLAYRRICKPNAAIVLTASQPFTSRLVCSNLDGFKYCWVWDKRKPSNFPLAKRQPMKYHEDIAVFCHGRVQYFPTMTPCPGRKAKKGVNRNPVVFRGGLDRIDYLDKVYTDKYPSSILTVSNADQTKDRIHPTQKPVALFEYLIKTYTNERALVLDNCAGSGTTAVACENLNRRWVCIEREEEYFNRAVARLVKPELKEQAA